MSGAGGFDYEGGVWGREEIRPGEHSVAARTLELALADLPDRGSVLEVGCGAGRMLGAVHRARSRLRAVGLDVSHAALAHASAHRPGIEWRLQTDPRGPWAAEDGEFDAVLMLDVLEHLDEPGRALAEARRVLAPGSVLHLHVPCEGDALSLWRWLPGRLGRLKRTYGGHVQRFRRADVRALLARAGFRIERERYSLQILGNLADVAVFCLIASRARRHRDRPAPTTGDVIAGARDPQAGGGAGWLAAAVRWVDAALWWEARWLARVPSWCLHVTARRD